MTDRDKIELPPLPEHENMTCYGSASMRDYAYTAVLADRAARAEPEKPAGPKVHRARLILSPKGYAWTAGIVGKDCFTADIRWTDDGRAWIESEDANRHAANLRIMSANKKDCSEFAVCRAAADALDGGVR